MFPFMFVIRKLPIATCILTEFCLAAEADSQYGAHDNPTSMTGYSGSVQMYRKWFVFLQQ